MRTLSALAGIVAGTLLLAATATAQVNLSPYVNSGSAVSLDSLTALGSSKIVSVVGAKYLGFQFTAVVPKDSLKYRVDASQDTSKGWINLDSTGSTTKLTATGTYGYYTNVADTYRYFRIFFAYRDSTGAKLRQITVRAAK